MIKKAILFFFFAASVFADTITLENKTQSKKIAIQWAQSARAVQESNESLMQEDPLAADLSYLHNGVSKVDIPSKASYFRVLVWEARGKLPDLVTNWVEIVPDKTYSLEQEHLTPVLLMNGMGC